MLNDSKAVSGYSVDDISAAVEFYGEVLGLNAEESLRGMRLHLKNEFDQMDIFVYPKTDHVPASFTVLNFQVDDAKSVVKELAAKGVVFEQYNNDYIKTDSDGISWNDDTALGPEAIAWFKDPAGNILSIVQG